MEKIIELALSASPAVILLAVIILFGKIYTDFVIKRLIQKNDHEHQRNVEEIKSLLKKDESDKLFVLEKYKMNLDSTYKIELNNHLKRLELHSIKIGKVLVLIEEFNESLKTMRVLYATYLHVVLNKSVMSSSNDTKRIEIHTKLLNLSGKLDSYLPSEVKYVISNFLRIISGGFKNGEVLARMYPTYNYERNYTECIQNAHNYLDKYFECYYELVYTYLHYNDLLYRKDPRLIEIINLYQINVEGADFEGLDFEFYFLEEILFGHKI